MKTLTADKALLLWNPGGEVVVLEYNSPENRPYFQKFMMNGLASYVALRKMNFEQRKLMVFIEAMHLIVRDKCDPIKVHNALLRVDEYIDGCADDMPGVHRANRGFL